MPIFKHSDYLFIGRFAPNIFFQGFLLFFRPNLIDHPIMPQSIMLSSLYIHRHASNVHICALFVCEALFMFRVRLKFIHRHNIFDNIKFTALFRADSLIYIFISEFNTNNTTPVVDMSKRITKTAIYFNFNNFSTLEKR